MARGIAMFNKWDYRVIKNFDQASSQYNNEASIQKFFAEKLANYCSKQSIPEGFWADLGSGTGLLANSLEKYNPHQSVIRIDGSEKMLSQHPKQKQTQQWNLNLGLPSNWSERPHLIASSFALHWLNEPEDKIKEWFSALAPGGWLAIAVPVSGTFQEWHKAASLAQVTCTAIRFPSCETLLDVFPNRTIRINQLERFTQTSTRVSSLLKPLIKVGAQASPYKSLKIKNWRKLYKYWPLSMDTNQPQLTWLVQILLVKNEI